MKDKNAQRRGAAHDPEMRFGGTSDGAGTGAAEHGTAERDDIIIHRDIREENRRSAAICPQAAAPVHTADGKNEMLRCGREILRAPQQGGGASEPRGRGCGASPRAKVSSHTPQRQGGGRRGTCARIAAPICAAVCALSLIHFSFSSGDISPKAGLSSDYIPAAITFTPPKKLEPKGFWDYFSEAMAEFFGFYER